MSAVVQHAASSSPANGSSSSVGQKRKRDAGPKFYAVRVGNKPGIYHSWADCLEQVKGVKNATFKSFPSLNDAEAFLKNGLSKDTVPNKYYGIRNGRVPGIYTDWETARAQIVGWTKPKYKSFATRAEAENFVHESGFGGAIPTKEEETTDTDFLTSKIRGPPAKKLQKKTSLGMSTFESDLEERAEPGTGPLPPGAEDGFDSRVILNATTGQINYKNEIQRNATKMQAIGPAEGSMLRIYTDGSSLGNGGNSAIAGVGVYFGPQDPRNVSEALMGARQTNQRAELTAIQRAIEIAPRDRDIQIYSDSSYAIKCVTEWYVNWRRNGWKSSGSDVKNKDLIELIVNKIEERNRLRVQTLFQWIKGHADDPGNVAADNLAATGARMARESNRIYGMD